MSIIGTSYIAALDALRVQFAAPLEAGGGGVAYRPVVVKRVFVPATPTTKDHYRLPGVGDPLVLGEITTALVNLRPSHQVSRGNGR